MHRTYKIDRLTLITYKGQKKKQMSSTRCRYLAKSHIVKCVAINKIFTYVNFRGSIFKKVKFDRTIFSGCDFWGSTFNECNFKNVKFTDSVLVGCHFKNCIFSESILEYSVIVNTNLKQCYNLSISPTTLILKEYPKHEMGSELNDVLTVLRDDRHSRKNKIFYISDNKYNSLNIYLLQRKFNKHRLPKLLAALCKKSTVKITTYKKLEKELITIEKAVMI